MSARIKTKTVVEDKLDKNVSDMDAKNEQFKRKRPILIITAGAVLVLLILFIYQMISRPNNQNTDKISLSGPADTPNINKDYSVCAPTGNFSFLLDVPFAPISEDEDHIALTTVNGLLVVGKKTSTAPDILKKYNITYKKEGNFYVYQLTNELDPEISINNPVSAQSLEKDEFIISLFYDPSKKEQVTTTLKKINESFKGGCNNA